MTYYAGIDVSLRSVNICVVDGDGEFVAETKLSSDIQEIIAYLDELGYDIDIVGLEAGTLAQYLTYGLQAAGLNVVCMEARQVKAALSAMRNKTDKHDARGNRTAAALRLVQRGTCEEHEKPSHPHAAC